jgi:hypothetical protein
MGTFAETAIVNNRLSFADQRKQTSLKKTNFRFRIPFAENNRKFAVSD